MNRFLLTPPKNHHFFSKKTPFPLHNPNKSSNFAPVFRIQSHTMSNFPNEILSIDRDTLRTFHAWNLKVIIVLLNHKEGMTTNELCAYLGERRSIYRALADLKQQGVVIEHDKTYRIECQNLNNQCQNLEKEKLIKDKDRESNKEKEKENIIKEKEHAITFSNARDSSQTIKDYYFLWLTDDLETMQALCETNRITVKDKNDPTSVLASLSPFIDKFIQQLLAKGKLSFTRLEIKEYFYNWLKKIRDSEIKKERSKRRAQRESKKRQKEAQRLAEEQRRKRIEDPRMTDIEQDAYEAMWTEIGILEGIVPDLPF